MSRRYGLKKLCEGGDIARQRFGMDLLLDVIEHIASQAALRLTLRIMLVYGLSSALPSTRERRSDTTYFKRLVGNEVVLCPLTPSLTLSCRVTLGFFGHCEHMGPDQLSHQFE